MKKQNIVLWLVFINIIFILLACNASNVHAEWKRVKLEIDVDNNGAIDSTYIFTYDANGNQTKQEIDNNNDGIIDSINTFTNTYDANGNLTKIETDNDNNGTIDSTSIFTYDANGNQTKAETDSDNNGAIDLTSIFTYDANGNQTKQETYYASSGIILVSNNTYDVNGNLTKVESDNDNDGNIDFIIIYTNTYDVNGNLTKQEMDNDNDGIINSTFYHTWEQFDPTDNGAGGDSSTNEINVQGKGINIPDGDPSPSIDDDTDFGNVNIDGGTVTHTFTIQSLGTADLELSGEPKIERIGDSDFTVTVQPTSPVAPGSSVIFEIEFDPVAVGLRTATISIANNDTDEDPYDFDIQGTGKLIPEPEINVQGKGTNIPDGDTSPSVDDDTDFGSVNIDGGTVTHTFTIQSLGTADLELSGGAKVEVTGDSDFTVTVQPTTPVAPGSSVTFEVEFDPAAMELKTATISIANNDIDEDPYDFDIQGTGRQKPNKPICISPADGDPNFALDPLLDAYDFSDPDQGDTQTASEWQVFMSDQEETDTPIFQQIVDINQITQNGNISFTQIQIPWGTLKISSTYKWRVKYKDNFGPWWSEWSEFQYFTTASIDQEYEAQKIAPPNNLIDPNIRGAIASEATNNEAIAFACDNQNIMVKSIDPATLPEEGKPANLPYGLFSIRIDNLSNITITVTYYLPGNYEGGAWYKYDPISGWYEYDNITFTYDSGTGYTLAEITLTDGGEGDFDGIENGVIVDPGGPTPPPDPGQTTPPPAGTGDGGGGCFIKTIRP